MGLHLGGNKMFRRVSVVFVVILCMTMSGCAAMKSLSGSTDEDAMKFRVSKDELWNETKMLKQYNAACRLTIQEKKGEIDQLTKQVADLNKEMADLKTEVEKAKEAKRNEIVIADGEDKSQKYQLSPLKEKTITAEDKKSDSSGSEKESVKQNLKADIEKKDPVQATTVKRKIEPKRPRVKVLNENDRMSSARAISEKLNKLGYKKGAPQTTTIKNGIEPKGLRVKVLSGNGKTSSARAMSEKLKKLGYKTQNAGLAPRSNFDVTTIYYARNYKSEAQHMATQLDGGAIVKPLTWPSDFHVIVVTGY
jgi:hypothetical protein